MLTQTMTYIIFGIVVAFLLAFLQYRDLKTKSRQGILYIGLRFVTYLSILLLLIDPKLKQQTYIVEKPELIIVVDNSSSIAMLEDEERVTQFVKTIKNDIALNERFKLKTYRFGNVLETSDTLSFDHKQTNISGALQSLNEIYKNTTAPTLLLTDGNQTLGTDYQYAYTTYKNPVFPIVIGDTSIHKDLKIERLNANRYAYLKNKFPVEVILTYDGDKAVKTNFSIRSGNKIVYTEDIRFSKDENSAKIINAELSASTTGLQSLKAVLRPVEGEKNTDNNVRSFAIEVIDKKAHIAIASTLVHPDIGTLKKMMKHNEQWEVTVASPDKIASRNNDFQLIILYQPNSDFKKLFEVIAQQNKNSFIITGPQTQWTFLNSAQKDFVKNNSNATEEVQPQYNTSYVPFITEDIGFASLPPLKTFIGTVIYNSPFHTLFHQKIGSVVTEYPLLTTYEHESKRGAVLFGEGIWKWRMEQYRKAKSFEDFDLFFGKLIQYLLSDKRKERMNVAYESFYYGNGNVSITAEFFDKNYIFNPRADLNIIVKDKISNRSRSFPLLLKNRTYEVNLSTLPASDYTFTITEKTTGISKSGNFKIIPFDVEQQFLNANLKKLKQLGVATSGTAFFINDKERIVSDLLNDERFTPIQKNKENFISLIDWKYLLILIIGSLSLEWFLRKYHGLI